MRLDAKVTAVAIRREAYEDTLSVTLTGYAAGREAVEKAALKKAYGLTQQLQIPASVANKRAYYVGRKVVITVEPQ